MIGKAYWATFKYYDNSLHKMAFKKRPVLIIGNLLQMKENLQIALQILRKNILTPTYQCWL